MNDRRQRLLRQPPRLQKSRKIRTFAQLRNAQLDGPGPRLPDPIAIAVALRQPVRALLAPASAGLATDLELPRRAAAPPRPTAKQPGPAGPGRQPLGRKAQHLAQEVSVGRLLQWTLKGHHLVGHRFGAPVQVGSATRPYRRTADDRRQLHHHRGHDLRRPMYRLRGRFRKRLSANHLNAQLSLILAQKVVATEEYLL